MKFVCPHCRQNIEAAKEWAGQTIPCPACGKDFALPEAPSVAAPNRRPSAPKSPSVSRPTSIRLPARKSGGFGRFLLLLLVLGGAAFGYHLYTNNAMPAQLWQQAVVPAQAAAPAPADTPPAPAATEVAPAPVVAAPATPSAVPVDELRPPEEAPVTVAEASPTPTASPVPEVAAASSSVPVLADAFGVKGPPARELKPLSAATRALITNFQPAAREVRDARSGLLHPGLGMTKAQLHTMQTHVRKGDQPWAAAFEEFAANERSSLTPSIKYDPSWTEILHGPAGKAGNFITVRMAIDGDVAFHQILMWYITGNEVYRLTAMKILRNYFSINKVEPHWDAQIRWGIAMAKLCFVADILRYSEGNTSASRWTVQDQAKFSRLLQMGQGLVAGAGYWMNQHSFANMGLIGTAVVLDDRKLYDECVERIMVNRAGEEGGRNGSIKWQMRLVTENAVTKEKVDPPQVQVVEMARDQAHAWINPLALSSLVQIIYNQGTRVDPVTGAVSTAKDAVDPFSFLDDRLLAGGDYVTRYSNGEKVTWIPIVMANNGNGKPPQIGAEIRGDPQPRTLGVLYNFYRYVKKWDSEDPRFRAIAQTYENGLPEADAGTDFPGNGTLLYTPEAGLIR